MRTSLSLVLLLALSTACKKAPVDNDNDGARSDIDCDDDDPRRSPFADEVCDGVDNDCDQLVDEDDPGVLGLEAAYDDLDQDGFGDDATEQEVCDTTGLATVGGDCDDGDADRNPEAVEVCDEVDNDCDGLIDAADADVTGLVTSYADVDGDGFGDDATAQDVCDVPGLVTTGGDCDDDEPAANPGAVEICGDGIDNDCDGSDELCPGAALPVAPSAAVFMGQGVQTAFLDAGGSPCTGHIALAVGDQAACYVDPTGELRCAGRIYTQTYGSSFSATGVYDVSQVHLTTTVNVAEGNSAYAIAGGVPTRIGYWNSSGQLGTGDTNPVATWSPWTTATTGATLLATGTSDQYCVLDGAGAAWCTGLDFGLTPSVASAGPHTSVWIDTFGAEHFDPTDVWRAQQGRASCTIDAAGLACGGDHFGTPGAVVDGGAITSQDVSTSAWVWLEDDGTVTLHERDGVGDTEVQLFAGLTVLAIGYHYYTDSVCAVPTDGSLWCIGTNDQGKLGTGTTLTLTSETQVAPAGTLDVSCQ